MANQEPTAHTACGDPAMTEELRDALTLLRDRSDDGAFRELVDEVLAGRYSLYDAASSPAFAEAVFGRVVQDFNERFANMTEEEKQAIAAQGGTESAALCADLHKHSVDGTCEVDGACEPDEVGPCGSPCRTCTAICGKAGGHSPN